VHGLASHSELGKALVTAARMTGVVASPALWAELCLNHQATG